MVYTDYRPTPLQHFMFPSGGDGLYLIVDERSTFREDNFQKAIAALTSSTADGGGSCALVTRDYACMRQAIGQAMSALQLLLAGTPTIGLLAAPMIACWQPCTGITAGRISDSEEYPSVQ